MQDVTTLDSHNFRSCLEFWEILHAFELPPPSPKRGWRRCEMPRAVPHQFAGKIRHPLRREVAPCVRGLRALWGDESTQGDTTAKKHGWRKGRQPCHLPRASCSFGKGDEGVENLIPRRHNARGLLLDHPIKPAESQWRSGIDDIQRAGTDCVRRNRSPSHWRCQRGGILYYVRAAVNAVNCDDGI